MSAGHLSGIHNAMQGPTRRSLQRRRHIGGHSPDRTCHHGWCQGAPMSSSFRLGHRIGSTFGGNHACCLQSGQRKGIMADASSPTLRLSGMPIRMKSVNLYPPGP